MCHINFIRCVHFNFCFKGKRRKEKKRRLFTEFPHILEEIPLFKVRRNYRSDSSHQQPNSTLLGLQRRRNTVVNAATLRLLIPRISKKDDENNQNVTNSEYAWSIILVGGGGTLLHRGPQHYGGPHKASLTLTKHKTPCSSFHCYV